MDNGDVCHATVRGTAKYSEELRSEHGGGKGSNIISERGRQEMSVRANASFFLSLLLYLFLSCSF